MPLKKKKKKALSRSMKQRDTNSQRKLTMKKTIKELKKATIAKTDNTKEILVKAYSAIDKAEKNNILHKNTAARRKSRLAKMVNKIEK